MRISTERTPIEGDRCHASLAQRAVGRLSYSPQVEMASWREQIKEKLVELLGMDQIRRNACPPDPREEERLETPSYTRIRFVFDSERDTPVPCYLLIPKQGPGPFPLAVALQGHTTGVHISLGETKYEGDQEQVPNNSLALQAVENGYACLCIEQRGLGERVSAKSRVDGYGRCKFPALTAFMLGRTVIGERVWDIMRALDVVLGEFSCIDPAKILITGNSGGGTASFYAACLDERLGICAPSCSFSPYKTSIMPMGHCPCNYLPQALNWFEMQDLACRIAPRRLIVAAGTQDGIFPLEGVRRGFEVVRQIYARLGVEDRCELIVTPHGHHWCPDRMWPAIARHARELGW